MYSAKTRTAVSIALFLFCFIFFTHLIHYNIEKNHHEKNITLALIKKNKNSSPSPALSTLRPQTYRSFTLFVPSSPNRLHDNWYHWRRLDSKHTQNGHLTGSNWL